MKSTEPLQPEFHLKHKKIWVAGETGMVGHAVTQRLQAENCQILSAPHSVLDLTKKEETCDWLKTNKPDVVIVAAAKVGGIGANMAEPDEFYNVNLAIAENVLESAYQAGVHKLLYLGSSCIYPRDADQPIKEEALMSGKLEPTNEAYARAKIEGIKLCQYYRSRYNRDFIAAMPTNLYGPHDNFNPDTAHVIPAMIYKIHQAKEKGNGNLTLWGTGTPLREFLYVDDLAKALIHLLKHYSHQDVINIGSGEEISIKDLADLIASIVGYEGEIIFDYDMPDGTPRKLLDSTKINNMGWKSTISLQNGLQQTYQWYLNNYQAL
jgi:GDP-L-fucose synthase